LLVANRQKKFYVVDFGGALGTTYHQNKKYVDALSIPKKWGIVEQSEYVKIERSEFQDNILNFYESISLIEFDIDLIMLNGSLCYIENPYEILDKIKSTKPPFILFTRTQFTSLDKDEVSIQIVSKNIYEASFPIWSFTELKIINYYSDLYEIFEIWNGNLQTNNNAVAKGILLKLI
jgi:putative methyltransferase (TIGR04325 family)